MLTTTNLFSVQNFLGGNIDSAPVQQSSHWRSTVGWPRTLCSLLGPHAWKRWTSGLNRTHNHCTSGTSSGHSRCLLNDLSSGLNIFSNITVKN